MHIMKAMHTSFLLALIPFALGCESGPAGKNLVDGSVPKKNSPSSTRAQEDRLPHERRIDEQLYHPRKVRVSEIVFGAHFLPGIDLCE
jgi:hypothetical protein